MASTVYNVQAEFQGEFHTARPATRHLVVHHAGADYPQRFGIDDVRAIRNYHVNTQGWAGIGYQEVLAEETPGGAIACYIVSDPATQRAHIWGRNHECFGICMAANFTSGTPEQKWQDALALRLAYHKQRWPNAVIVGHGEIALAGHGTLCPGARWQAWKPALLANVANLLKPAPPSPDDPLRARTIPGIDRAYFCGTGFASSYATLGGLTTCGYPLTDEARATDQRGEACTWMRFERLVLKYKEGEGVRPALLTEAAVKGWLP